MEFELNSTIISTLTSQGIRHMNMGYLRYLLNYMKKNNIPFNGVSKKKIEDFLEHKKKQIISYVMSIK